MTRNILGQFAKKAVNHNHIAVFTLMLVSSAVPGTLNWANTQYQSFTAPAVFQGIPEAHASVPTDLEVQTKLVKDSPEFKNTVEALAQANAALILRDKETQIVQEHVKKANEYLKVADGKQVQAALGWDDGQVAQSQAVEKSQGRGNKQ